ncbi:MAG: hypothetical protein KIS66_06330 [Fimbriimonadaceae bacterium]|nr:hypothetical protein [Fimbriimonadaceae bacterium]
MLQQVPPLALSLLGSLMFIATNVCMKLSVAPGRHVLMYVGFAASLLAYSLFRQLLVTRGLALSESVFGSLITLGSVLMAIFILKESMTARQAVGIAFIVAGLIIIS